MFNYIYLVTLFLITFSPSLFLTFSIIGNAAYLILTNVWYFVTFLIEYHRKYITYRRYVKNFWTSIFFLELTRLAGSLMIHLCLMCRRESVRRVGTHTSVITIDFSPVSLNPLDLTAASASCHIHASLIHECVYLCREKTDTHSHIRARAFDVVH